MNNSKTIAIMQPYFFPYLGYWQLLNAVDIFVIYDDVNYINRGFINRNTILLSNKGHRVTCSVKNASQNRKINEHYYQPINKQLIGTIRHAYLKAPYYEEISPIINDLLLYSHLNVALFNANIIKKIACLLSIPTKIIYSSEILKDNSRDKQGKIIDMAKSLKGNHYINPIGGVELYNTNFFKENAIQLSFLKSNTIAYKQNDNEFIANLSIIDVLMFNGIENTKKLLNEYELLSNI